MGCKEQKVKEKPFRVLALDGGGIRGLYTATLLDILTDHFSKRHGTESPDCLGEKFDLITGTSTGGIIAIGLAAGIHIKELVTLYEKNGLDIFPEKNCLPSSKLKVLLWALKFRNKPSGNRCALETQLKKLFGDKTLNDIYQERKIRLCIPCVDAITQKPAVIKTPHFSKLTRDGGRKAVDVCLATSAAPLYFPVACLPRTETDTGNDFFVDGGLWANNPVLIGVIEALHVLNPDTNCASNRPIEVVSVGTCSLPQGQALTENACSKGTLGWKLGADALTLSLEAQAHGHFYMAKQISRYLKNDCRVIRLDSAPPSLADAPHFGLDRAYKEAICVLKNRAVDDARSIQSLYNDPNNGEDIRLFASIITS